MLKAERFFKAYRLLEYATSVCDEICEDMDYSQRMGISEKVRDATTNLCLAMVYCKDDLADVPPINPTGIRICSIKGKRV